MVIKQLLLLGLFSFVSLSAMDPRKMQLHIQTADNAIISVKDHLIRESITIANLYDDIVYDDIGKGRRLYKADNNAVQDDNRDITPIPLTEQTFRYIYQCLGFVHTINNQVLFAQEKEDAKQKLQEHLKSLTLEKLLLIIQGADFLDIPALIEQALNVLFYKLSTPETKKFTTNSEMLAHILQNLPYPLRKSHICNSQQIYPLISHIISHILCHFQPDLVVNDEAFFDSLPPFYVTRYMGKNGGCYSIVGLSHNIAPGIASWRKDGPRSSNIIFNKCYDLSPEVNYNLDSEENVQNLLSKALEILTSEVRGHSQRIETINWIIISSENKTAICSAHTKQILHILTGGFVGYCIPLNLVVTEQDGEVFLWNLQTDLLIHRFDGYFIGFCNNSILIMPNKETECPKNIYDLSSLLKLQNHLENNLTIEQLLLLLHINHAINNHHAINLQNDDELLVFNSIDEDIRGIVQQIVTEHNQNLEHN